MSDFDYNDPANPDRFLHAIRTSQRDRVTYVRTGKGGVWLDRAAAVRLARTIDAQVDEYDREERLIEQKRLAEARRREEERQAARLKRGDIVRPSFSTKRVRVVLSDETDGGKVDVVYLPDGKVRTNQNASMYVRLTPAEAAKALA